MTWKQELSATRDCVPLERFDETLSEQERDHIAHCARCEAEFALWEEFRDATPSAEEGAAVQWIATEVARRRAGNPAVARERPFRRGWFSVWRLQTLAAAAAVVIVGLTLSQLIVDREPAVVAPAADRDTYRSERLEIGGPTGDLRAAPREIHWVPVKGAERYDVVILEVDRTILWRATTREPRIELPAAVIAQFVPGKTILWEVSAHASDGTIVAQSGTQRFRVAVTSPQGD